MKGSRLGPYEILDLAGAGGMGEVYRARDTRLGRTVAIKILPEASFRQAEARTRFEREARAIARLNHPHICALYDVGETTTDDPPRPFLVMEHVEGKTLDEKIKRGALPFDQVLRYGIEIADALDTAHRNRILHRDLKLSNIMIGPKGCKLLDFGLAKFIKRDVVEETQVRPSDDTSPYQVESSDASLTAQGIVVGTLAYMAPEQLQGREPDERSDIYSLGVCLYEMATGRRPFRASDGATLKAAILEQPVEPVSHHRHRIPAAFDWLVRVCLDKDPSQRFQTAHDVMLELKRITDVDSRGTLPVKRTTSPPRLAVFAIVLGIVAAVFAALRFTGGGADERRAGVARFSIALPANAPLTTNLNERLAVSPDGRTIVYSGGTQSTQLYAYSVETQQTTALPGTVGAFGPFFAPDGNTVGFYTPGGELKKVSLPTGQTVVLRRVRDLRGATWAPDNTIVFAELRSPLQKMSSSGGTTEALPIIQPRANVRWPSFLPGSDYVLYTLADLSGDYDKASLAVLSLKTGVTKIVLNGGTYGRYFPPDHLVYFHADALFAVPFDVRKMLVQGPPSMIAEDVDAYPGKGLAHYAVSATGSLFYVPRAASDSSGELVSVDRAGRATELSSLRRPYDEPRLSPDGKRAVVTVNGRNNSDLWLYDIASNAWRRLTNDGAKNTTGIFSPDGSRIAFASNKSGGVNVYVMATDGGSWQQITERTSWPFPSSWTPDGRAIATGEQYADRRIDVFVQPVKKNAAPVPVLTDPFEENFAAFSPDGRWIAYQSNESGQFEIYVQHYPAGGEKWMISSGGGTRPMWSHDGQQIFYRRGDALMSVTLARGGPERFEAPLTLFSGNYEEPFDVFPDGQHFLMIKKFDVAAATQIKAVLGLFRSNEKK